MISKSTKTGVGCCSQFRLLCCSDTGYTAIGKIHAELRLMEIIRQNAAFPAAADTTRPTTALRQKQAFCAMALVGHPCLLERSTAALFVHAYQ
jgi:hypothetical protein